MCMNINLSNGHCEKASSSSMWSGILFLFFFLFLPLFVPMLLVLLYFFEFSIEVCVLLVRHCRGWPPLRRAQTLSRRSPQRQQRVQQNGETPLLIVHPLQQLLANWAHSRMGGRLVVFVGG